MLGEERSSAPPTFTRGVSVPRAELPGKRVLLRVGEGGTRSWGRGCLVPRAFIPSTVNSKKNKTTTTKMPSPFSFGIQ